MTISIFGIPSTVESQAPAFLSVIDDVPLMPGLREDVDGSLSFDMVNGRIAEAKASGPIDAEVITEYYAKTLPQLGWKLKTLIRYLREDEVLSIEIVKINGVNEQVMVYFRLSPAGTK